jgi:hypothetical protein
MKVSMSGGPTLSLGLGNGTLSTGASWGSQGMIAFAPNQTSIIQQVPDVGGTPRPLTHLEKGETSHRWPEFLPGGKVVLFAAGTSAADFSSAQVAVQSLGTGERRDLAQGGTNPRYAASGHLIYVQGGNLIRSPAANRHGRSGPCGGRRNSSCRWRRPVQFFVHAIAGLCSWRRFGFPI